MKNPIFAVLVSFACLLGATGCSSCGEKEAPAVESTTQAAQPEADGGSTTSTLSGPRHKAPALKGALAPLHDGGASK